MVDQSYRSCPVLAKKWDTQQGVPFRLKYRHVPGCSGHFSDSSRYIKEKHTGFKALFSR